MKKLIALIFMLTFSLCSAATINDAVRIYKQLIQANDIVIHPMLHYSKSTEVNASCSFMVITINNGMLRFVRNDAELALVLGHELAHYSLGHTRSTPTNEYAADALGALYMSRAGYSVCTGANVLKRFHSKGSNTHPDSYSRYKSICH